MWSKQAVAQTQEVQLIKEMMVQAGVFTGCLHVNTVSENFISK